MVRLIPVKDPRGLTVWQEVAPKACPDGHQRLGPKWGACPGCDEMMRVWRCLADGCKHLLIDYDHQCPTPL